MSNENQRHSQQKRLIEWSKIDTGESIGKFPLRTNATDDYFCPTCGDPCTYNEGQIDQDIMGNDIHGWWFDCYECGISSESTEGQWNDGDGY